MTPTLLFADDDLVVVDKPSGWLVHAGGPDSDAPDLGSWLAKQDVPTGLAPAHRLDLGTSGVVLFGSPGVIAQLGAWFSEGRVTKRYQALVFGKTRPKGIIKRPLQDGRRGKKIEAVTRYHTVEAFKTCSLLDITPQTGRKHQIRRHFQGLGHALVGDTRYGPRGRPTVPAFPGRLWLHAASLTLPDDREFEAPLPPELVAHLDALRDRAAP
jgi:23S rRNA-/tRNA-specific pseudouridylate synthase